MPVRDSAFVLLAKSGHSPPTPNPHRPVTQNRRGQPARDFPPWRFSDATIRRASPATPCRASEKPAHFATLAVDAETAIGTSRCRWMGAVHSINFGSHDPLETVRIDHLRSVPKDIFRVSVLRRTAQATAPLLDSTSATSSATARHPCRPAFRSPSRKCAISAGRAYGTVCSSKGAEMLGCSSRMCARTAFASSIRPSCPSVAQ